MSYYDRRPAVDPDHFWPCNDREHDILARLSGDQRDAYIAARHAGATVTVALETVSCACGEELDAAEYAVGACCSCIDDPLRASERRRAGL